MDKKDVLKKKTKKYEHPRIIKKYKEEELMPETREIRAAIAGTS